MSRERSILHFNVADFAVAVERVADRSLVDRPVIVAPLQAARAAVYDMSDEAYRDGVRKGMALHRALRRCRAARVLPPRFGLYQRAMAALVAEAREYTPLLEYGRDDGHLFLDVTGSQRLFGPGPDIGWRLRSRVSRTVGIESIWSLGTSKLVTKVASRLVKPTGEYIVAPGEEEAFLAPVSLDLLPGLRPQERWRLREFHCDRVGQLAAFSRDQLHGVFGGRGETLYLLSRGSDTEALRPPAQQPEVVREYVFAGDSDDQKRIAAVTSALAARVGMELRHRKLAGRRLVLELDYASGARARARVLRGFGVAAEPALQEMALEALGRVWKRRDRVRSCRLCCDRLQPASPQLSLFAVPGNTGRQQLLAAMDRVRHRFGPEALRFAGQARLS